MNLKFTGKPIFHLVKALSAAATLTSQSERLPITDDNDELLTIILINGYTNLCGRLLQYIDTFSLDELETGSLTITLHQGITRANPLAVHSACERYLAMYILKEMYLAGDRTEAAAQFAAQFRSASNSLLQILAL